MPEVDLSRKKYWQLNSVIKFGKYKGEDYTVAKLIKLEPTLLIWYDDNIEWFNLDDDVRIKVEEAVEKEREAKRNSRRSGVRLQVWMGDDPPRTIDDDNDEIPF
jgi:hypothetical protein